MTASVITRLWARQPGRYFCVSTKGDRWRDHFFEKRELDDLGEFIADHRLDNIYFCPHAFSAPRRIKANAVPPRCLYADLDEVDPRRLRLRPTIAIESSPGRYVGLWRVNAPITERVNKRLTYHLKADKGGWDLTQVLRMPETWNYKYNPPARVRVLWDEGPVYRVADLERMLPHVPMPIGGGGTGVPRRSSTLTPLAICDKHELNGWLRHQLLKGRQVGTERRHRIHWRLACELHDAGVPAREAFVLLRATGWNKHTNDAPVWNMIDKIWND
jgi:RepB DNA-primase from phage plasmid